MQLIFKRGYRVFTQKLIPKLSLYQIKGYLLRTDDFQVRVANLSADSLGWSPISVLEKGRTIEERDNYFGNTRSVIESTSKMIQMDKNTIYIIGGLSPSLLTRAYDVIRSCLKVNIETGELIQCADLLTERWNHTLCSIGHHIYLIGGYY